MQLLNLLNILVDQILVDLQLFQLPYLVGLLENSRRRCLHNLVYYAAMAPMSSQVAPEEAESTSFFHLSNRRNYDAVVY